MLQQTGPAGAPWPVEVSAAKKKETTLNAANLKVLLVEKNCLGSSRVEGVLASAALGWSQGKAANGEADGDLTRKRLTEKMSRLIYF